MISLSRIAGLAAGRRLALSCASVPGRVVDVEEPEPVLVGPLSRAEIEAAVPDWIVAQIEARPDVEQAIEMAAAGAAAEAA